MNEAIVLHQSPDDQHRHLELPKLPDDVIVEILARLPVRSLLRFRCVCKLWLSLISTPRFVKSHIEKSKTDSDCHLHGFMLNFFGDFKKCSVPSLLNEPTTEVVDVVGYSANLSRFPDPFVGSCDGLICLAIDRDAFILWNPSTRVVKELPRCCTPGELTNTYFACGFGYDKSSDDYKVVRHFDMDLRGCGCVTMEVYSLKEGKWKISKSFLGDRLSGNGTFVNGRLHWVTYPKSRRGLNIVAFDLRTEEYRVVGMADWLIGEFSTSLGESEGRLVVFANHKTSGDLWIVDDDGVGMMRCCNVATIHYDDFLNYKNLNSVYLLKNGQVVVRWGSKFVVFDAEDDSFRCPVVRSQGEFIGAIPYFESLVSL